MEKKAEKKIGWGSLALVLFVVLIIGNTVNIDRAPIILNAVKNQRAVNLVNLFLMVSTVILVWKFPNDMFVKFTRRLLIIFVCISIVIGIMVLLAEFGF